MCSAILGAMNPLRRLRADIAKGRNLEVYLTVFVALVVAVLGVFSIVRTEVVAAATLATLALIALTALGPKRQVSRLELEIAELNRLLAAKLAGDAFLTSVKQGLDEQISRADDIRFVGVTLSRTIRSHVESLSVALARGASVRVLIIDLKGTVPEEAARRSTIPNHAEVFEHRTRGTIYVLRELPGVELRFLPFLPAFGLVLLDDDTDVGVIHIELGTHRSAGRDPIFTLTPQRDRLWYEHFKAEFNRMWEVSREAEDTDTDWKP